MSLNFISTASALLMIGGASVALGCGGGSDGSGVGGGGDGCTGTVIAEWDIDGVHYKSSNGVFIDVGAAYTFNVVACRPPGSKNDKVLEFGYFATPVAAATFTLKDKLLTGMSGEIHGVLFGDGDTTYRTDPDHMGTFTVTAVDSSAMTFDGTFDFTVVTDDGTTTAAIANGVITKLKYSVLVQ